jgi:hypothetical protein
VQTRQLEALSTARYMSAVRASHIRFRMDETNSVSCGGREGVSDTFASALWAVQYIVRNMAAGVSGINFHGDPANCGGYAPLCARTPAQLAGGLLSARPEWYALLLARALIGDRPVRTIVTPQRSPAVPGRPDVSVTALLARGRRMHVVIVNDDPPAAGSALVQLHVPARFRRASILALTAPSPQARSGVTLGGRSVAADGSWRAPPRLPGAVRDRAGVIALTVPPSRAMLVTISS